MSEPLATHDLNANGDEASPINKLPYFNTRTDFAQFDPLEYRMGMQRGGLLRDLPGDILLKVRLNLILPFFESLWILLPEDDILKELMITLREKKPWGSVPSLKAKTYNYRLFYLEDQISFKDATGHPCKPGSTVITSTMHPCLTIFAASRFFLGQRPGRGQPRTGFDLLKKQDWQHSAFLAFACVSAVKKTCPISFFETDRSLDEVRPTPVYIRDDSKPTRKDSQVVEVA
ncbi:hypothetical protein DXG01_006620 [Tephrocybe rancida]|nr:hypothetical protein DXG01_006620 [Tephrocybe rancida]